MTLEQVKKLRVDDVTGFRCAVAERMGLRIHVHDDGHVTVSDPHDPNVFYKTRFAPDSDANDDLLVRNWVAENWKSKNVAKWCSWVATCHRLWVGRKCRGWMDYRVGYFALALLAVSKEYDNA
ncbi:MAG: hypothetical protein ACE5FA_00235 [Dehalococcoidia bacterium]